MLYSRKSCCDSQDAMHFFHVTETLISSNSKYQFNDETLFPMILRARALIPSHSGTHPVQ